jgi:PAS domain S-box-containing protein
MLDQNEDVACVVNFHGRILEANPRFCRMFGFENDEPQWHYFVDLYRHASEWKLFHDSIGVPGEERHFLVRLRNRKGRSFKCKLTRVAQLDDFGRLIYINTVAKIDAVRESVAVSGEGSPQVPARLYFTVCSGCSRVRDEHGQWIEAPRKTGAASPSRQIHYCPACAEKMFPGVFEHVPGAQDEELAVAVH